MRDFLIKAWINFWYVVVTVGNWVKSRFKSLSNRGIKNGESGDL